MRIFLLSFLLILYGCGREDQVPDHIIAQTAIVCANSNADMRITLASDGYGDQWVTTVICIKKQRGL